jgi:hypothetical protein
LPLARALQCRPRMKHDTRSKLSLARHTIRSLSGVALRDAAGGLRSDDKRSVGACGSADLPPSDCVCWTSIHISC